METPKLKPTEEWFAQADYDMETAQVMFDSGRFIYVIFMCHLSIEKALKGIFTKKFLKAPKKTHDLVFLSTESNVALKPEMRPFIERLSQVSIPTRYPEELSDMQEQFPMIVTQDILKMSKEVLQWLKQQL